MLEQDQKAGGTVLRKPDDWMPLNVRKYLGDTMHLNTEQHGAYMLLLMAYWMRGGPLPGNDNELAAIARAGRGEWRRLRPILEPFFVTTSGQWVQKRAEEELAKARRLTEAKSAAGRKGAANKWQTHDRANGTAMAKPSETTCQTDAPLPSPLPSLKKDLAARMARFDEFWLACPKKTGHGAAEKAWLKAVAITDADTLIAGMRAYAGTCPGKDKAFIKTPGPWLNEKRWLDEGIAPSGEPVDQAAIDAAKDKADRYFKRGQYAPDYRGAA
jgi:uncharacterized protein YdaU (DUF1376 family)